MDSKSNPQSWLLEANTCNNPLEIFYCNVTRRKDSSRVNMKVSTLWTIFDNFWYSIDTQTSIRTESASSRSPEVVHPAPNICLRKIFYGVILLTQYTMSLGYGGVTTCTKGLFKSKLNNCRIVGWRPSNKFQSRPDPTGTSPTWDA